MCFCTSRQNYAQRQQLREITEPITQIFSGTSCLCIINTQTQDTVFENTFGGGEPLTQEQLRDYMHAHASACEIARLYKEKTCPVVHMEQKGYMVSIYYILATMLLIFRSAAPSDLMLADGKMKTVLQRLIDNLEGRSDK